MKAFRIASVLLLLALLGFGVVSAAPVTPPSADPVRSGDIRYAPFRFTPVGENEQPVDPQMRRRPPSDLPRLDAPARRKPRQTPGQGDWGIYLTQSTGYSMLASIMGAFNITKVGINDSVVIYAPTMLPVNSCLEITFIHTSPAGTWSTSHALGVWDHCINHGWIYYATINASTWGPYTLQGNTSSLTDPGVQIFDKWSEVRVVQFAANCTAAYLYNVSGNYYAFLASQCGTPSTSGGWMMFETYGMQGFPPSTCTNLGAWNITQARGLLRWNGSIWTPATATDYGGSFSVFQPCLNAGSGNWYGTERHPPSWPMVEWHVCGPNKPECRP